MVAVATLTNTVARRLCWSTIAVLLLCLMDGAHGQIKLAPRLHDSFGRINTEDVMARLDFFAIELQKHPHAVGHIVAHGPEGEAGGTGREFQTGKIARTIPLTTFGSLAKTPKSDPRITRITRNNMNISCV